jgi:hypothetical protein
VPSPAGIKSPWIGHGRRRYRRSPQQSRQGTAKLTDESSHL